MQGQLLLEEKVALKRRSLLFRVLGWLSACPPHSWELPFIRSLKRGRCFEGHNKKFFKAVEEI